MNKKQFVGTKKFLIIAALVMYAIRMQAQNVLKGRVIDTGGQAIEFATVAFYAAVDSTLQQGVITNVEGQFVFEKVNRGKYYLTVSMIGYEQSTLPVDIAGSQAYVLPDITLHENAQQLQEVTVTATRRFVEQHADKMVINPEASITTASDDALEVLRKSPGIIVDKDNNVTLKNKSVQVMIDGRPTYLSGEQLASTLRGMQATSIDRIEIIENPSSRFDAEGDGGIINIRTKRSLTRGYNGIMTLGARASDLFSANYGINLNYRTEKMNVYGDLNGNNIHSWNQIELIRSFPQSDGSRTVQMQRRENKYLYHNARLGVDYYITPRQVLGFIARGNLASQQQPGIGDTRTEDAAGREIEQMHTVSDGDNKGKNLTMNLNYKWTIDSLGQELSVDGDMAKYVSKQLQPMTSTFIPPKASQIYHKDQRQVASLYAVKADYMLPAGAKTKMEMGAKASWVSIDSDLEYIQQDENGAWSDPGGMSNRFVYSENIYAAYVSANHTFNDKTSVQLGLRGEQTFSNGTNRTSHEYNERNYFNLFPSFFALHKFNEHHQLGVSYSYRIGRPPYDILNPFLYMIDPYTYNRGNPFLDAQFTHASRLSYTLHNKYIVSLSYSYTNNAWMQVFEQDDATRTTLIAWENLSTYHNAGFTLVLPIEITRWWKTNTNLAGFYGKYKSPYQNGIIDNSQFTFQGNTTFSFTLPKDFAVELTGNYWGKSVYGMAYMNARGLIDIGAQKQFFNKKATLKLSISDVFKIWKNGYTSQYENVSVVGKESYDSRRVNLTLTWRFGRTDIKAARQRRTGLEEETGRVSQ